MNFADQRTSAVLRLAASRLELFGHPTDAEIAGERRARAVALEIAADDELPHCRGDYHGGSCACRVFGAIGEVRS